MGLVHVYTGCGKGKTTCSLGLALRALGWGRQVCIVQFIKGWQEIGEMQFACKCDSLRIIQPGECSHLGINEDFVTASGPACRKAYDEAAEALASGKYHVVILDEINGAVEYGHVSVDEVLGLIENRGEAELVLTGRNAAPEIIKAADYVTEMKLVKHPFDKGIPARQGVDY